MEGGCDKVVHSGKVKWHGIAVARLCHMLANGGLLVGELVQCRQRPERVRRRIRKDCKGLRPLVGISNCDSS